jgi:hypothetical protein
LAEELEDATNGCVSGIAILGLGWRETVARQKNVRDRDRILRGAPCRVEDLFAVAELDGDGVTQEIAKCPLAVAGRIGDAGRSTEQQRVEVLER